jgi:periplasmic protein TonB
VVKNIDKAQEEMTRLSKAWTLREEFLDTALIRNISYGNLVLRRQAHLFLTHGVIVAMIFLFTFWTVSANWGRLTGLFGMGRQDDIAAVKCYEVVTNVTQLPPPPPIAPPEPVQPKATSTPVEAPPNVGKIKKVAEAPPDQTLATQKEIKQAIQQGANSAAGNSGGCETVEYVACQVPPVVLSTPKLIYPEMARIAGIEGRVFIRVLISEDGRAMKADILKRIPADCTMFDKEAVRIAMESKYSPGQQNGNKVRVFMTIPVRFTLHES